MSNGNGWPVIDVRQHEGIPVVYLRIPMDLASPIDGGCSCEFCKAHPELIPRWDCLAVAADWREHSWTVHYPVGARIPPADQVRLDAKTKRRRR